MARRPGGLGAPRSVEDLEIDLGESLRVDEEVELDDPALVDREGADRERDAPPVRDDAGRAVDERLSDGEPRLAKDGRLAGDVGRATDDARPASAPVGAKDDVGGEDRDERIEVAPVRGRQEGVHDPPLGAEVGVSRRRTASDPLACPARKLTGGLRRPIDDRRDLFEGNGEHVVEHESQTLGGR